MDKAKKARKAARQFQQQLRAGPSPKKLAASKKIKETSQPTMRGMACTALFEIAQRGSELARIEAARVILQEHL